MSETIVKDFKELGKAYTNAQLKAMEKAGIVIPKINGATDTETVEKDISEKENKTRKRYKKRPTLTDKLSTKTCESCGQTIKALFYLPAKTKDLKKLEDILKRHHLSIRDLYELLGISQAGVLSWYRSGAIKPIYFLALAGLGYE